MLTPTPQDPLALTAAEQASYAKDGYLVREAAFGRTELAEIYQATEYAAQQADRLTESGHTYFLDGKRFIDHGHTTVQYEHSEHSTDLRVLEPVHLHSERINELVDDPRLTIPMQSLVGSEKLSLWTAKLNMKPASIGSGFGWHQDSPYWIHDCDHVDQLPNVMLTLNEQTLGNGCFRVIRGSHHQGILPGSADGTQLGGFFTDPSCIDLSAQVAMEVAAGSLIFFSPHSIHGSEPNNSSNPRRALILTYQPGDMPLLKTGEVRNVNF